MKEIKPGYYASMHEIVAELKAKIPGEPKTINLHSDGFDICFDYHSFSKNYIVTMFHGVSIKMEGLDLAMGLGFKESEILLGPAPIVALLMAIIERYTALYVYTDSIQNQLVGDVRSPLLGLVPAKSRYGDMTYVTYKQPQFFLLSRSNIQTV